MPRPPPTSCCSPPTRPGSPGSSSTGAGPQRAHLRDVPGLITCCEAIAADPAVKALIITGAGDKAFAAGTDIAQFRGFATADDALGYDASWTGARRPGAAAGADHRGDRGRLHGRRRGHRGGLRPAGRDPRRPVRLPHRPDARQLPEPGQSQAGFRADRPGPGQGHHLHRRLVGAEEALAIGLVGVVDDLRGADRPGRRPGAAPGRPRAAGPCRPPRKACAASPRRADPTAPRIPAND